MHATKARALWIRSPGCAEIRTETVGQPSQDDVLIRAMFSAISRGTEALVFHGRVPPSEYVRMRAPFQAGDFPGPVKYGYASVGEVERGPDGLVGRTVFVLYPHQTHYVVPAGAVSVVPDRVPARRAVLAANLETAVNSVWDARPDVGDRVVVIGGGTVGCLVTWLVARVPGVDAVLVDRNASRLAIARALGASFSAPETAPRDVDLVFHASGSPDGLALALSIAGFESTVVDLSWYGTAHVPLPLGEAFHARRLTLKSSQVGHVAPTQRARWDRRRRMQLVMDLLDDPVLDQLLTGECDFDELPAVLARVATTPGDTLCQSVRYAVAGEAG